jgi:hypothetical protein
MRGEKNESSRKTLDVQTFVLFNFGTVKAPNFGRHGNFGPLFQKRLLSLKENRSCKINSDLQIRFCSFFVHDSSTEAAELARKSPKFP